MMALRFEPETVERILSQKKVCPECNDWLVPKREPTREHPDPHWYCESCRLEFPLTVWS